MWKTFNKFIKTVTRPISYVAEGLLIFAIAHNMNRCATALIRCGVDVNCNNSDGTPLWHAVKNRNPYLVNKLLANNVDVNSQKNADSQTVLHLAASVNGRILRSMANEEIIYALLKVKPEMNLVDKNGQTPLHIAVKSCNTYAVKALVKTKADVNIQDKDQETPIMKIVSNLYYITPILKTLIFAGARLDLVDKSGRTVLEKVAACRSGGFNTHIVCNTLIFFGAKLKDLEKRDANLNFAYISPMMGFNSVQRDCIKKSASLRASISEKINRTFHPDAKVSGKILYALRSDKSKNLPEEIYPKRKRTMQECKCDKVFI